MSDLQDLLGIIGSIGNSAGIKGDGPTGLNAIQRASLPTEQQSALAQLNARGNTDFSNPQQAIQQMYKSGNVTGQDALTALANPMLQVNGTQPPVSPSGNINIAPPQPNAALQSPSYPGGLGSEGPDDKRNYQFLATMPPIYRGLIKGISEGDEHAGMMARANPNAAFIMNAAYQFDPTLTQPGAGPDSRVKTNVAFGAGGPQGLTRSAINTTIQHTAQLAAATNDMNNNQNPIGNTIGNWWNQEYKGKDAGSNFDSIADRLAPELAKVSSGTGAASEGETNKQRSGLQKNGSPEQQYGALSNIMELVANKSKELGNTYKSTMGRDIPMITPENQQHLADIQRLAELGKVGKSKGLEAQQIVQRLRAVETPQATPDASGGNAPTSPQQSQFKEGQSLKDPKTGQRYIVKNGVPVPREGQ